MFGGYYLGQLYLGISGLPATGTLSPQGDNHQLSSDNINLTQKHFIVVDSAGHTLTSGNITLTQKHVLAVENAIHTHFGDNASITSEHFLGMDDAYHGVTSTQIQLTQKHTVVVQNTTHGLSSNNTDLTEHKTLAVNNTLHGHTVQSVTLAVKSYLSVANGLHGVTYNNISLTQKQTLAVANAIHSVISTTIGGLINLQPYGMGGGFGAVDGFGIAEFGNTNIELPINLLILAEDSTHNLWSDDLDTFIQIFNMIRKGEYTKDFGSSGDIGSEYSKDAGTMPVNNGYFGQITPVSESDNGFLIVKIGASGSYTEKGKESGTLITPNSSQGIFTTDEEDTGNYIKIK